MRRAVHFARQQNRARASAEKCAAIRGKLLQRVEQALFRHHLQMSAALAARKDHAVEEPARSSGRRTKRVLDAKTVEHRWRAPRSLPESQRIPIFIARFTAVGVSVTRLDGRRLYQPRVCSRSFSSICRTSRPFIASPSSSEASSTIFGSL